MLFKISLSWQKSLWEFFALSFSELLRTFIFINTKINKILSNQVCQSKGTTATYSPDTFIPKIIFPEILKCQDIPLFFMEQS